MKIFSKIYNAIQSNVQFVRRWTSSSVQIKDQPASDCFEMVSEVTQKHLPNSKMTPKAKEIYDAVSAKIQEKVKVTSEFIDSKLKPKEKAGTWSKEDMTSFYTKLEKESDAKIAAEIAQEVEAGKVAKVKNLRYQQEAEKILAELEPWQLEEFRKLFKDAEVITYNKEIVRHATSPKNAESLKVNGYDFFHSCRNNGTNHYGGMDVEALSIADLGKRYGSVKLEYEFSGKAIKIPPELDMQYRTMVASCRIKGQESVILRVIRAAEENPELYPGDIQTFLMRAILEKLGYDAIAVAPRDKTLFLTILNPDNAKGLKYVRTISS